MKKSVFLFAIRIAYIIRTLILYVMFPIFKIPFFRPKILDIRKQFELKNQTDEFSRAFDGVHADVCVSVSSEGELEQSLFYILYKLSNKKRVEIIYTSPSVEHKIKVLAQKFPDHLRALRLPLITELSLFSPKWHKWVSAPHFIFCRYDFYFELLLMRNRVEKMEVFSAALNKKKLSGLSGLYLRYLYGLFDRLYLASPAEEIKFRALGVKIPMEVLEWRVLAIDERLENRYQHLHYKLNDYLENLEDLEGDNFIFGSAWPVEWPLIKEVIKFRGQRPTFIFPHDTSDRTIAFFKQKCVELQRPFIVVGEQKMASEIFRVPGIVVIFKVKGILLESFGLAPICYIGGGFGRSIHSVLEPFLAMSKVIVGPKIHRSTEFELFKNIDPDTIEVIEDQSADSVHSTLRRLEALMVNKEKRKKFKELVKARAYTILQGD